jgi:hypothetical protein
VQSLDYYCRCRRRREPLCAHIKLVGARRRRSQCILYPSCGVRMMHADERRELKHNHYGNALRNENSRALHFILYPRPALSMHTCRICALIYTQANKSRMNFFLITRDIKERARLERSLNYYRSTAAFASYAPQAIHFSSLLFKTQESRSLPAQCTHSLRQRRQDVSNRKS